MESMKENEGECSCFFLEVLQTCPKYVLDISRPTLFHDQVTVLCAFIIIKCLKAYHKRTANWNRFSLHNASHRLNKSQYSVEKFKRQPASAAQAPFGCLREALRQFIPWCPLWCPIRQCSDWSKTFQGKWSRVSDSGTGSSNSATPFKHQDVAWYVKMFTTGIVFAISIPTCCGWF